MFATLLIAADLAGSIAVSDRSELRVRAPGTSPSSPSSASVDVENTLDVRLRLASRRFQYTLAYMPRLTLWDANTPSLQPTVLNAGEVRVEWLGRHARLAIDENASYGGVNFAAVTLTPGATGSLPRLDVIPKAQVIQSVSSSTTLTSQFMLRRWSITTFVGYQLSGGADGPAQQLLPLQSGPFGEANASVTVSRTDDVISTLSASEASFTTGAESVLGEVDEGWRHQWSRITETRLSLGVSEARVRTSATGAYAAETHPVAQAVLERHPRVEGQIGVRAGVRLGPVVNRLVGIVDERVEASLAASHTYRRLTTHVFASASQSLPTTGAIATSLLASELGVAYGVHKLVTFDAGLRGLWQRQASNQATFLQGTMFVGVTFRAPPTRL